jgi:hypothetical protein
MLNADCLAVLGKLLARFLAPSQNKFQTLLPHLLALKAGALAGSFAGPGGALIGGGLGAIAPSIAQLFGSGLERQAAEGVEDISAGKALAAAVPGAALEAAATFIPLGRSYCGKILGPGAEQALARGSTEASEALAREESRRCFSQRYNRWCRELKAVQKLSNRCLSAIKRVSP